MTEQSYADARRRELCANRGAVCFQLLTVWWTDFIEWRTAHAVGGHMQCNHFMSLMSMQRLSCMLQVAAAAAGDALEMMSRHTLADAKQLRVGDLYKEQRLSSFLLHIPECRRLT